MTNIQYKVDDMTGAPMDVKQWVDTEVSEEYLGLLKLFWHLFCGVDHSLLTVDYYVDVEYRGICVLKHFIKETQRQILN